MHAKRSFRTALALTVVALATVAFAPPADAAVIYFVDNTGQIRSFTGITDGATPADGNAFVDGINEGQVAAYGAYQGFTSTADGTVYGVNGSGGVDSWSSIASWLAGDAATSESTGVYGAGSGVVGGLHGISVDPVNGNVYGIVEGAPKDGRLRQWPTIQDFIDNTNFTENTSFGYGGNILNFYYPDEDAPAASSTNGDALPGSNYYQSAGNGQLEGWIDLFTPGYGYFAGSANPGGNGAGSNRSYQNPGFSNTLIGAFAVIPEPASFALVALGGLMMLRRRTQ